MTRRISARNLAKEGWQHGLAALGPNLRWLGLFALSGAFYNASLHLGGNLAAPLAMAILTFGAGIQLSRGLYRSLIGPRPGGFLALAHANSAVYLAFLFIGFFLFFFVGAFGVAVLQTSGVVDLGANPTREEFQAALNSLWKTPYGWLLLLVFWSSLIALAFIAARLITFGAATTATAEARVFRTWGWTKGHSVKVLTAGIFTHLLPATVGTIATIQLWSALPDSPAGHLVEGAAAILLFTPFLAAGHGMAAAAYRRLRPEASGEALIAGPEHG